MKDEWINPNGEVIYKEMTSEQKLKLLCGDFVNSKGLVSEDTLYILCLTAYYMGKCDGLELEK